MGKKFGKKTKHGIHKNTVHNKIKRAASDKRRNEKKKEENEAPPEHVIGFSDEEDDQMVQDDILPSTSGTQQAIGRQLVIDSSDDEVFINTNANRQDAEEPYLDFDDQNDSESDEEQPITPTDHLVLRQRLQDAMSLNPIEPPTPEEINELTKEMEQFRDKFIASRNRENNFWVRFYTHCQRKGLTYDQIESTINFIKNDEDITVHNVQDNDHIIRNIRDSLENVHPKSMTTFYKTNPDNPECNIQFGHESNTFPKNAFGETDYERTDDDCKITLPHVIGYYNSIHPDVSQQVKMDNIQINLG